MRSIGILLLSFLLLALESPALTEVDLQQYTPDLVLVIVIYLGLTSRFESGVALALALGVLKDGFTLGSSPVGMYMEISVVVFMISYRLSRRLALRGPLAVMLIACVFSVGASLLELVLRYIFARGFEGGGGAPEIILASMLPQVLATAPFAPVLFWLYDKLDGLTIRKKESLYL